MSTYLPVLAAIIEFVGALIITVAALRSVIALIRHDSVHNAKAQMASGAISGLDFKLAATLLKALSLVSWENIGMFASIYAIRLVLKQAFNIERKV